jgi:hypothetical protein
MLSKLPIRLGHITTFSYADSSTDGNAACAPASGSTAAFPTLAQNHLGHQSVTTYNSMGQSAAEGCVHEPESEHLRRRRSKRGRRQQKPHYNSGLRWSLP